MLQSECSCDTCGRSSQREGYVGAVAYNCTGEPATGDFSKATVGRKFGDVPDDLSPL
jgi:hypothetical protein